MRIPILILGLAVSTIANAAGGEAAIQLKRGLIWAEIAVEGADRPLHFVVDTGAEESVLNLKTARRLGRQLKSRELVQGVAGMHDAYRTEITTISCAGVHIRKQLLALDLPSAGRQIDGLLGADFFAGRVVEIDYGAKRLRVLNKAPRTSANAEKLPIRRNYGAMCVPLSVGDVSLGKVRIDTGYDGALEWVRPGAASNAPRRHSSSVGFASRGSSQARRIVKLGNLSLRGVQTSERQRRLFPGEDGLLGNALLQRFRVTVDMRSQRLVLDPR